jgi:hypothetical protein
MKLRYAVRYLEELSVVACISTASGNGWQCRAVAELADPAKREEVSLNISSCVESPEQ